MNKKYKLKGWVVFSVYAISIITIISSLYLVGKTLKGMIYSNESISYVYRGIIDDAVPVVSTTKSKKFIMPYQDENVKIIKNFYDKDSDNVTQENSLILYQNTYMPNTGVIYKGEESFDVLAVYEGEVIKVEEDEIMGTMVTIKHSENIMGIYGSLKNVIVKEGDIINKQDRIGESGKNNLSKDLGDHLHFELIVNGKNINPEKSYSKTLEELNK